MRGLLRAMRSGLVARGAAQRQPTLLSTMTTAMATTAAAMAEVTRRPKPRLRSSVTAVSMEVTSMRGQSPAMASAC